MPLRSTDRYYEWEGIGEKWITNEESFDSDFPSKPQKSGDPVAKWVIEGVFGLTLADDDKSKGSTLPGYDIIGRDPYDVINLSLIGGLAEDTVFYECYMDGEGIVRYHSIGQDNSDIDRYILWSIDNGEFRMKCDQVMVTGYDPPPKRYAGNEFNLLTFANTLISSDDEEYQDKDRGQYPLYTTFAEVLGPEACPFRYEGFIEYGGNPDTLKDMDTRSIELAGVYNPNNFESVLNYVYKIDVDFFDQYNTTVKFVDTSVRYVELPGFGKLQTRNWIADNRYVSSYCLQGQLTVPASDVGVRLPRSNEYKFKGVSDVYIYGYRVKSIRLNYTWRYGEPTDVDGLKIPNIVADPTTDGTFVITVDTMLNEPFKLSANEDYMVVKDPEDINYSKIVFSCNVSETWLDYFGGNFDTDLPTYFRINESCLYASPEAGDLKLSEMLSTEEGAIYREGYLLDTRYTELYGKVDSRTWHSGVIFPTGEGGSGYVVNKIVVVYQWDNPSIQITDLRNDITTDKLREDVRIGFYPMILKDLPAPIAFSGPGDSSAYLLDQNEVRPDYDPATAQNFEATEWARAMSSMEAGDVRVVMPFADGDECIRIATKIKELQTNIAHDVVYMCTPDADPVLGEKIGDGVINEIDYSYQDSSQYLISVTAGPQWRGGQSWDQSLYKMETDTPSLTGVVLKISEDNTKCNVRINKIGVMECINATKEILGVGDKVKVSVYNNPVKV